MTKVIRQIGVIGQGKTSQKPEKLLVVGLWLASHDLTINHHELTISPLTAHKDNQETRPNAALGVSLMDALTELWQQDLSNKVITGRSPTASVLVISNDPGVVRAVSSVCDFLDLAAARLTTEVNVGIAMRTCRTLAVIVEAEGCDQDGFNVMKEVAAFDRDLPVMVLTHGDQILAGAADAVQEAFGLRNVCNPGREVRLSEIVDFLAGAGRRSGALALLPT